MPRQHSLEFKKQILAQAASEGVVPVAKQHNLSNSMIYGWRRQQEAGKLAARAGTHRSKATPEQKAAAVAELRAGGNAVLIAKKLGVSDASLYNWRKKETASALVRGNGHDKDDKEIKIERGKRDVSLMVISILRQAKDWVMERVRSGEYKEPDQAHRRIMDALDLLQGK